MIFSGVDPTGTNDEVFSDMEMPALAWGAGVVAVGCLILFLVGAVVAIRRPARSWQDRLADTVLVRE